MKILFFFCFCLILPLCAYSKDPDWERLEQGEPVVWLEESDGIRRVTGKILINAPVENCWKVLSDLDTWSEWAPGMKEMRTVWKEEDNSIVIVEINMLFITVHASCCVTFDYENKTIVFHQLSDEEYKKYESMGIEVVKANWTKVYRGEDKLEPYGDKTIWTYTIDVDLKIPAPKRVENFVLKVSAPGTLQAGKTRIESILK